MTKSKKKNRSATNSAVRKPRAASKLHARKAKPKNLAREKKIARRSPKTSLEGTESPAAVLLGFNHREKKLDPFVRQQKQKLLQLRDAVVDSMAGVAQGTLRSRAEGSEASAFGMHQADAGSDAYDRDFALSLLSQEQDALYEIDEALKRIEIGTYGRCEMSGKPIPRTRLEAIPFARFTVECQSQLEKQSKAARIRPSVTSLFGLTEEEGAESEEEEATPPEVKE
jgi:RNA polymerase-binding transcription factor DksA